MAGRDQLKVGCPQQDKDKTAAKQVALILSITDRNKLLPPFRKESLIAVLPLFARRSSDSKRHTSAKH